MAKRVKRVLSIDGGGIRGILPAVFLRAFENYTAKRTGDLFDLAVGTSTGGIIALALTHPTRSLMASEMLEVYLSNAHKIFDSPRRWSTFSRPKYSNSGLRELGALLFGEAQLSEAKIPTAVTAYDIAERRPRVLKSWKAKKELRRDCHLWEAALATAAAPTYFPAVKIGERTLIDGGVFANNPSAIALAEAKIIWPDDELILVSLGTGGSSKLGHLANTVNSWGALHWIGPLMDIMFDGSSDSVDYIVKTLLKNDRYYRFQISLNPELAAMDKVSSSHLDQLRAAGAREVDNQREKISLAVSALQAEPVVSDPSRQRSQEPSLLAQHAASSQIVVPDNLAKLSVRCSFSGLMRIEIDGYYLLVQGGRLKHQYQPVGGVYKRYSSSFSELQELGVQDDDSRDDIRVRVPGENIHKFFEWFQSRRGREIDPWREFYEELIETGILDRTIFPYISFSLYKTQITGIRWSEYMNCYELLVSEIFVLHPTADQVSQLVSTKKSLESTFKWVTRDQIRSRGLISGVATIAPTAEWLI